MKPKARFQWNDLLSEPVPAYFFDKADDEVNLVKKEDSTKIPFINGMSTSKSHNICVKFQEASAIVNLTDQKSLKRGELIPSNLSYTDISYLASKYGRHHLYPANRIPPIFKRPQANEPPELTRATYYHYDYLNYQRNELWKFTNLV